MVGPLYSGKRAAAKVACFRCYSSAGGHITIGRSTNFPTGCGSRPLPSQLSQHASFRMVRIGLVCAVLLVAHSADAAEPVDFKRDIQPLLSKHCYECHGPGKQEAGLRLDRRDPAFKGG